MQQAMPINVDWRVSKECGGSNCVQVAAIGEAIAVRDSKDPQSAILWYSTGEWKQFLAGVKNGDFDDLA
jgi:Domain of unknown function (DUF397)